jgi:hypothetical protein
MIQPVFLLSLPRAGSTLLQRLLMAHPAIGSCGEPWLALPMVQMFEAGGAFSTYGHSSLVRSGRHLMDQLPAGRQDLLSAAGSYLREVYTKLSGEGTEYFLDKTPRYYKIIAELQAMLPEAKFIVLRREPVAVYASILNYIEGQMHLLPTWEQDIVEGIPKIGEGLELLSGNCHLVDYEKLVVDPSPVLKGLLDYLGLEFSESLLGALAQTKVARGDQTGMKKYSSVSAASLDGWKQTVNSRVKRRIASKWFERVSAADFERYGYDKGEQLGKLSELSVRFSLRDELAWQVGSVYFNYQLNVLRWGHQRRRNGQLATLY